MPSDAQLVANRTNAEHSTGPKTSAGKATSSLNALRHGLTSRAILLPGEDEAEYAALRQDTLTRLAPFGELESALAETVVTTFWKYIRMERIESAYMVERTEALLGEHSESEEQDGITVAAGLFADPAESQRLALVLRYLSTARNAHARAVRALEKAQKDRYSSTPSSSFAHTDAAGHTEREPQQVVRPKPPAAPPSDMTRAERRALERAWRKSEKRARRNGNTPGPASPVKIGFVSQSEPDAA